MLRDDAVARIKRRLLYRSGSTIDADIVNALQDAQVRLEGRPFLPWFLVSEVSSILTTSGEERIPLPTGFIREIEQDALWYYNSAAATDEQWTPLMKDDLDALRSAYPGVGAPKAYALLDDYFRIFPTPDAAYTLKMIFYKEDTVLDTNVENGWLLHAPWLMIGEAGADIAASLGMEKAEMRFDKQAADAVRDLFIETTAREEAGRSRVKGGYN